MKGIYYQRGETLDYVNAGTSILSAGTVVKLEKRIGVIGCDIPPGGKGSVHVSGVFQIPATVSAEIKQGAAVFFNDTTGITTTSTDTPAGFAAEAAKSGDTFVVVKIG